MTIPARLRGPLAKVAMMQRDELITRASQALTQRWDSVRCRLGAPPVPGIRAVAGDTAARFYFDPGEVPALIRLLRERLPLECEAIVARAGKVCEHRFDLLGYENLRFGEDIDWHLDPVSGRRAPLLPWYRVPFLDFDTVGDAKVVWELNRHQHWVVLAKAHLLTRDPRYLAEIGAQWRGWWAANPYPRGINWASALEVAFRSMSWLWVLHLLAGADALPAELSSRIRTGLALNGRHLETYLSTYFSPNTHLLGEAVALFLIGLLVPEVSGSDRWRRRGWRIVVEQAARQVFADGLHFERSAYYHVYALDLFLHARVLADRNGLRVPEELDRVLLRQLDVLRRLDARGTVFRFGDDDGGRVFDGARNRGEHLLDPLATGAALFERPELKASAGELREETIWLLGERGARRFDALPGRTGLESSTAFHHSKLYLMTASEPLPRRVLLVPGAATPLGGGHAHADLLSVQLALDGRLVLSDSGTFTYVGAEGRRDRFRGTESHNTLQVGGRSQGEPSGPFSWESLPEPTTALWVSGATFDLFCGYHEGYGRPTAPLRHTRWVFNLRSGPLLVRDLVEGVGAPRLDLHWHLAPGATVQEMGPYVRLACLDGRAVLALVTPSDHGWESRVETGRASPVYGREEARAVLRYSCDAALPAELATLLCPVVPGVEGGGVPGVEGGGVPSSGGAASGDGPPGSVSRSHHGVPALVGRVPGALHRLAAQAAASANVAGYEYHADGESHHFFFALEDGDWQLFDWKSDASFLYCRMSLTLRRISEAIVVGGTYVRRGRQHHAAPGSSGDHWVWQG